MICDGHSHILHQMDDGADSLDSALTMCEALASQGVKATVLCPAFTGELSIARFIAKRKQKTLELSQMLKHRNVNFLLIPSAEVPICKDTVFAPELDKLLIPTTRFLPCTLPLHGIDRDIKTMIVHLVQKRDIIPYFLHIERYILFYAPTDLEWITQLKQAVFCVSVRSFHEMRVHTHLLKMLFNGKTVLPVTNAHDLSSMPPEIRSEKLMIDGTQAGRVYTNALQSSDMFFRPMMRSFRRSTLVL